MTSHSPAGGVHPVLALVNRCDELARTFDSTFEASCNLLRQPTGTLDDTLAALRSTLDQCEQIVGAMLACIYEDIPHLLDQLDSNDHLVANWNPKLALESISTLFYVSPPTPHSPSSKSTTADFFWLTSKHSRIKNCCWKSESYSPTLHARKSAPSPSCSNGPRSTEPSRHNASNRSTTSPIS